MKELKVKDILKICNGKLVCGTEEIICDNFVKDNREVKLGDVFIGIKGEKVDGNSFYKEALEKGASVCLLQKVAISEEVKTKYSNRAIVLVDDTIEAIGKLAAYKRSFYTIPVIAVTGSVGKTSTKDIIASVVSQKYKVLKTQGNFNNHIGLPLTLLKLKDHEAVVVEMGMNHLGEIAYLSKIAKPTIAVITNIGTSHIGNLGSRETILKAKLEIIQGLQENGILIINNDNDLLHKWNEEQDRDWVITCGIEQSSTWMPYAIQVGQKNSQYQIKEENKTYSMTVPISGRHFVYNSCMALAVGRQLEISIENIQKGIEQFELTKKRMDTFETKEHVTIINDSYNASYDSTKAALEYLKEIAGKRKIAVLGDMLELGEYANILHEAVGEEVVKNKINLLITIGEFSQKIANRAKELGMEEKNITILQTNQQAISLLHKILQPEDVVLLKASNAMNLTQIAKEIGGCQDD